MVVFRQSGCIRANWLVLGKSGCIWLKWLYSGKSGCFQAIIITIIIIYNLYRGKAPVTGSDFQGGPLRVKIKYTKAKNIQYN